MKVKRKALGWVLVSIATIALVAMIFWPDNDAKPSDSHNQAASTSGDNSPAVNQSAIASGSNSIVVQAAAGATVNLGLSDANIELIRKALEASEKENKAKLDNLFPGGYTMFTATTGEQIVSLNRVPDQSLDVTSWANCSVKYDSERITIIPPDITVHTKGKGDVILGGLTKVVPRNSGAGSIWNFIGTPDWRLSMWIIKTNEDSLTIAFGLQSPK